MWRVSPQDKLLWACFSQSFHVPNEQMSKVGTIHCRECILLQKRSIEVANSMVFNDIIEQNMYMHFYITSKSDSFVNEKKTRRVVIVCASQSMHEIYLSEFRICIQSAELKPHKCDLKVKSWHIQFTHFISLWTEWI